MKDELTPILKKIEDEANAIVLGSPIYFSSMSGEMRSFLERLMFAPLVYSTPPRSLFPHKVSVGIIYTMNSTEEMSAERGYRTIIASTEASLRMIFGSAESLCSYDTYQFPDYSKVIMEYMDPAKKAAQRATGFPEDCRKAFELGRRLTEGI